MEPRLSDRSRRVHPDTGGAERARGKGLSVRGPPFLLLLLLLTGCDGPEASSFATTTDTVGDVIHVRHSGRAPEWTLEPVLSLGDIGTLASAPSPEEFGRVRSVVSDAEGRVFIADGLALEIRVFGPDGAFLRRLGRKGGGPGEMEGVHGAAWLGEDTLVVMDFGNARLMRMTANGEHVDQWPWLRISGSSRFYHQGGRRELYAYAIRTGQEGQRSRSTWVRYTPEGPVDSLDVPREEPPSGSAVVCRGDGIGFFSNPFADRLLAAPAPGGERVVGRAFDYRLAFLDAEGDTIRVLTREVEAVPLADAAWDSVDAGYREFRKRFAGAECEGSISRPPQRPVLRDLFYDHDGRLLVEHTTPAGPMFDLFGPAGRWLATIPAPVHDRSVPPFLRDDHLYLTTLDSLGIQRVRGFRLTDAVADRSR